MREDRGKEPASRDATPRSAPQDAPARSMLESTGLPRAVLHRKLIQRSGRRSVAEQAVTAREVEVPGVDPGEAFGRATAGGGGEVPHRQEMERSFGHDFASVQAHTGRSAEMDAIDAHAATQ